jgi:hypothetical protein
LGLVSVLWLAACYDDAAVMPCTLTCDQTPCPANLVCGSDHVCQAASGPLCSAASPDAPPGESCVDKWIAGPTLAPPAVLLLSTVNDEVSPFVSADGLELWYSRTYDIWEATRAATDQEFSGAVEIGAPISTSMIEDKFFLASDKLQAFFVAARGGGIGGNGYDLWRATRPLVTDPFTVDQTYLGNLDTGDAEIDPHLSSDLRHLYFARHPVGNNPSHILLSTRDDATSTFTTLQQLPELSATAGERGPTLTADERVIVFAKEGAKQTLWYATRATSLEPFQPPILVPDITSNATNQTPHITADGCTLYFSSDRGGNFDLYTSTVQ